MSSDIPIQDKRDQVLDALDRVIDLAENRLGEHAMATPTFCGNRVYMRVAAQHDDKRLETLYCIAAE